MAVFTIKQNTRYKAELRLTGFEAWASNEMVVSKLEEYGFIDIVIRGSGEKRLAEATWPRKTQTGEVPPQIVSVKEVKLDNTTIEKVLDAKKRYLKVQLSSGVIQERFDGTVAWRCQNPGNLKNTRFSKSYGSIGQDHLGHAVFPTLEAGNKAHFNLLFNPNSVYYNLTLLDALKRYAPESDGNNPYKYQRYITQKSGIESDRLLRTLSTDEKLIMLEYMQYFEGYKEGLIKEKVDDNRSRRTDSERVTKKRTTQTKKKTDKKIDGDEKDYTDYW